MSPAAEMKDGVEKVKALVKSAHVILVSYFAT